MSVSATMTDVAPLDSVQWESLDVEQFRSRVTEMVCVKGLDSCKEEKENGPFLAWLFLYLCSKEGCESLVQVLLEQCESSSSIMLTQVLAHLNTALRSTFERDSLESMACLLLDFGRSVAGLPQRCLLQLVSLSRSHSFSVRSSWPRFFHLSQCMRLRLDQSSESPQDIVPEDLSLASSWTLQDLFQHYFVDTDEVPNMSVKATSLLAAVNTCSPIQVEILLRDIDTLDQLLPIYTARSADGTNVLFACCHHNNPRVLASLVATLRKVLLDWCESDLVDKIVANELSRPHPVSGKTCLMVAFENQSSDLFRPLLSNGAAYENTVRCRVRGWSAFMYLFETLGPSSRLFFLSRISTMMQTIIGANRVATLLLSDATSSGLSPLSFAASIGDESLVEWMASYCVSVGAVSEQSDCYDTADVLGYTPLFYACTNGQHAVAKLMLQAGATPLVFVRPGLDLLSLLHLQIVRNHRDYSLRADQRERRITVLYRITKLLNTALEEDFQARQKCAPKGTLVKPTRFEDYRQIYFEPFFRCEPVPVLLDRWQTLGKMCCQSVASPASPPSEQRSTERRLAIEWMARVWSEFGAFVLTHCSCAKDLLPYVDSSTSSTVEAPTCDAFKDSLRFECTLPEVFVRACWMYDQVSQILPKKVADVKLCGVVSLVWCYLQYHAFDAQEVDLEGRLLSTVCRLPIMRTEYHIHPTSIRRCLYALLFETTRPLSALTPTPIEFVSMLAQREYATLSQKIPVDIREDLDVFFNQVLVHSLGFLTYLLLLSCSTIESAAHGEDGSREFECRTLTSCPMSMALFAYNIGVATIMRLSFSTDFPRLAELLSMQDVNVSPVRIEDPLEEGQEDQASTHFVCHQGVLLPTSRTLDSCVDQIIELMQTFSVPFVSDLTNLFSPHFIGRRTL